MAWLKRNPSSHAGLGENSCPMHCNILRDVRCLCHQRIRKGCLAVVRKGFWLETPSNNPAGGVIGVSANVLARDHKWELQWEPVSTTACQFWGAWSILCTAVHGCIDGARMLLTFTRLFTTASLTVLFGMHSATSSASTDDVWLPLSYARVVVFHHALCHMSHTFANMSEYLATAASLS